MATGRRGCRWASAPMTWCLLACGRRGMAGARRSQVSSAAGWHAGFELLASGAVHGGVGAAASVRRGIGAPRRLLCGSREGWVVEPVFPPTIHACGCLSPPGAGLMEPGPLRGGGGMHVGPGDPIFGPGRLGGGVGRPPGHGSLPPGARWDPIAPPGMRGFGPGGEQGRTVSLLLGRIVGGGCCRVCGIHSFPLRATRHPPVAAAADDFQREPGQPHPDMMQPGPGRGRDFDEMFG